MSVADSEDGLLLQLLRCCDVVLAEEEAEEGTVSDGIGGGDGSDECESCEEEKMVMTASESVDTSEVISELTAMKSEHRMRSEEGVNEIDEDGSSCKGERMAKMLSVDDVDTEVVGKCREDGRYGDVVDVATASSVFGARSIVLKTSFPLADVVDLTGEESDREEWSAEKYSVKLKRVDGVNVDEALVWGGEASEKDGVEIEKMMCSGVGIYGSVACKLEVKRSLLKGANRGVFLKEDCVISNGECITRYSGRVVRSPKYLSVEEQLRTIQVGKLFVVGKKDLETGDGFGSLMNSSVVGRTYSFCRFVSYKGAVYVMASYKKKQYPLIGSIELYLTAGHSWWTLFNSVSNVDG